MGVHLVLMELSLDNQDTILHGCVCAYPFQANKQLALHELSWK